MISAGHTLRPPRPLRRGSRVAVLAISSPSTPDRIEVAVRNLEAAGLDVVVGANVYDRTRRYLAGDDEARLGEINRSLRDPSIDGFLFTRGGYGAMRILDRIDYAAIAANPRPIIGYSDLTALHQAVALRAGVGTFHGPMLNTDFHDGLPPRLDSWFWDVLEGRAPLTFAFDDEASVISGGSATGVLFGGCLSLTAALAGTPFDYWVDGGIWFWEDVSEPTYRLDRMLTHLRLSGRLASLRGVMIGKLKDCGGEDPRELDLLLSEFFSEAGIPVIRDLPFGHFGSNLLLPIGCLATLDADQRTLTLPRPASEPGSRPAGEESP